MAATSQRFSEIEADTREICRDVLSLTVGEIDALVEEGVLEVEVAAGS